MKPVSLHVASPEEPKEEKEKCDNKNNFPPLKFRADVDGLRSVAVIPVLLFHFKLGCEGGFAGVDVFFTISGFLICSIILNQLENNRFSLTKFWGRRVRRLFPAAASVIATCLLVGWFCMLSDHYAELAFEVPFALGAIANFFFHYNSDFGYFADVNTAQPLLHCWSLAVEEQFYFIIPVLLVIVFAIYRKVGRPVSRGVVFCILLVFMAASFVLSVMDEAEAYTYFMITTRAWEMFLGCLLPCAPVPSWMYSVSTSPSLPARAVSEVLSWGGLAMILASYWVMTKEEPYPSYRAALPCFGTVLFIAGQARTRSSCGWLLARPLPVLIGQMSYSLYLWHWPIYVFMDYMAADELTLGAKVAGMGLSFAMAILSWHYVEKTFRRKSSAKVSKTAEWRFYGGAALVWLTLMGVALAVKLGDVGGVRFEEQQTGFPPFPTKGSCQLNQADTDQLYAVHPAQVQVGNVINGIAEDKARRKGESKNFCRISEAEDNACPKMIYGGGRQDSGGGSVDILVVGNSHGLMYVSLLEKLAVEYGVNVALMLGAGYQGSFTGGEKEDFAKLRENVVSSLRPAFILWFDFWVYSYGSAHDFAPTVQRLSAAASERLLIFQDPPLLPQFCNKWLYLSRCFFRRSREQGNADFLVQSREDPTRVAKTLLLDASLREAAAQFPGKASFVEVASAFKSAEGLLQMIDPWTGRLAYWDESHLTLEGALRLEPFFREQVFEPLRSQRPSPNGTVAACQLPPEVAAAAANLFEADASAVAAAGPEWDPNDSF